MYLDDFIDLLQIFKLDISYEINLFYNSASEKFRVVSILVRDETAYKIIKENTSINVMFDDSED